MFKKIYRKTGFDLCGLINNTIFDDTKRQIIMIIFNF